MGEVYRARDTRLDRIVAIKILPAHLSDNVEAKHRFDREARAISSLNHPNICTLYDVGHQNEIDYLVMELLEGETLADRLAKGPLPLEKVLKYAIEICQGLEQAHKTGVIHRDLKPGNVMLTKTGAKLMDFGLAKASPAGAPPVSSLTMTIPAPAAEQPLTARGTLVGTFQYMSPEQLEGKEADARSDIFALGAVLYEMVTGKRAFTGKTQASLVAAVLASEPQPISVLQPMSPPALDRAVKVCLAKDPDDRFQSVQDLKLQLKWIAEGGSQAGVPAPVAARRRLSQNLAWSVVGVLAIALAAVSFQHFSEKPPAAPPIHLQIPVPEGTTLPLLNLSPDGRKLAFLAGDHLWVHFLESGESHDLTAADGSPFWSPDSRWIGYPVGNKVKKIEATGGAPQTVADFSGSWGAGAWNQDDVIVYGAVPSGLFRVPASGGVPVQITAVDRARRERSHYCPSFLPDGRHFVYIRASTDTEKSAIYAGSVDAKPEQQSPKALVVSNWGPQYAPSADPRTGYLLFMHESTLMAQPIDNARLELKGEATPIVEQVGDNGGGTGGYGGFSASANDVLVYLRTTTTDQQLTWQDREGKVLGTVGEPGNFQFLALSPDGTRVALSKRSGKTSNIWLLDLSRDISTRFTFGSAIDSDPVWSPDGTRIIFRSGNDLYQKAASGVKDAELLLKDVQYASSWSRDGRFILFEMADPKANSNIWVLPLEGDKKPFPFRVTQFRERDAQFSPDGHWVAYISNESGGSEIYVQSFALNSAGTAVEAGGKWQISNGRGLYPRWRGDGRELYYRSLDGRLMAVEITTHPEFRPGKPQPLGIATGGGGLYSALAAWDCTADGRRFLAAAPTSKGPVPYSVILNWQAALKK
jgi:serine/threonine protein kinase